ncbi:MAG: aromatic ring-hydroxylating dioxygenase subunit alpha [Gammaproteobacteria bacterium]|nr:aromatic ring-hydroxylating dioxygenase subunit alpha [Gammaproteobacteria bacterium]
MYINFWYPVALSSGVTAEKPLALRLLGLGFVAFRDSQGRAHVLADTCVHRGGSLSRGVLRDDCVVCPYHGWRYDGDGHCVRIPALGDDAKIPARAKVDSYPVEERYGLVFAFLGDLPAAERPPLYDIPEFGKEGWRASEPEIIEIKAYYERSVENGLDPAHNEFVHPSQGSPKTNPDVLRERLAFTDWDWGGKFWIPFTEQHNWQTDLASLRSTAAELGAGSGHHGPNTLITWIHFSRQNAFHQYLFEAPVDEWHTRAFFINLRNCLLDPKYDSNTRTANMTAIHEDRVILEALHPVRSPDTNNKEILIPGDQAVTRYRACLRQWESRGWRIDRKALRDTAGDVAWAIPCPARRESGNWVLDTVPLVKPSTSTGAPA